MLWASTLKSTAITHCARGGLSKQYYYGCPQKLFQRSTRASTCSSNGHVLIFHPPPMPAVVSGDLTAHITSATTAADAAVRQASAEAIAAALSAQDIHAALASTNLIADLRAAMANKGKTAGPSREGACQVIAALATELKASAEPYLAPLLDALLDLLGDKVCPTHHVSDLVPSCHLIPHHPPPHRHAQSHPCSGCATHEHVP